MAKTKILFVSNPMWTGGIEKELLAAIRLFNPENHDITLMLTKKAGHMLGEVPDWVRLVELPLHPLDRYCFSHGRVPTLVHCLKTGHWIYAARMLLRRVVWNLQGRSFSFNLWQAADMMSRVDVSKIDTQYDFAFAYAGGLAPTCVVRFLIKAPVTAVWCHDESQRSRWRERDIRDVFGWFTHRFTPSRQLQEMMNASYSRWGADFEVMPYITDFNEFRDKAGTLPSYDDGFDGIRLLSVGRIETQKGFDYAAKVAGKLKAKEYKFRWYIVGYGSRHDELDNQISNLGIGDVFVLLGKKDNPYPYFRDCDIYVQPSRFEAFCITIAEAKAFHKPIVATDFAGARDQIEDGKTGIIIPVENEDALYTAIAQLLDDKAMREAFSLNQSNSAETDTLAEAKKAWRGIGCDV